MNKKSKIINFIKYAFLIILSFISVFPFIWMVIATTNKSVEITKGTLIPGTYFLENLKNLLASDLQYMTAFKNSLKIAVITTVLAMLISSLAGYAFEVYKTKARDKIFKFILLSMMVPFAALMVPLFRMFSKFSNITPLKGISLNTHGSVIIISVATAFLIFFFRQNTKSFPKDLIEAARIDGLGEFGIFFKIYMPTMKSTYSAATIVTFMASWNNYLWPLIALQSPEKRTLPLVISALGSSYTPDYGIMMTAVLIATLPTALIFFLMQKHFVAGMTGSMKG
jgi:lactose/L-arabinose transport system permease protein